MLYIRLETCETNLYHMEFVLSVFQFKILTLIYVLFGGQVEATSKTFKVYLIQKKTFKVYVNRMCAVY